MTLYTSEFTGDRILTRTPTPNIDCARVVAFFDSAQGRPKLVLFENSGFEGVFPQSA